MTNDNGAASANVYGSTLYGSFAEPLAPANFRILKEETTTAGRRVHWEIRQDENRAPQAQVDTFEKGYAGWASSTADPRFRGYVVNPLKVVYTLMSLAAGGSGYLYGTDYAGTTVMARGNGANAMYKVTDMATAIPVAVTYNPGAYICSLFSGPIGGATRLFIGREGTTTDIHSTIGTSATTMHTDFNSCWGGDLSPLNATNPGVQNWLIYCGTTLKTLPITAAATDASASTPLATIPGGGTVWGFETLEKSPKGNRFFMGWPRLTSVTRATIYKLVDVNAEGTDPQENKLSLSYIKGGRFWNHNWVGHDDVRIVRFDGQTEYDLNLFTNVAANSDRKWTVFAVGGSRSTLRVCVQFWDLGTVGNSRLQWWEFMPQTNSWLPCSEEIVPYGFVTVADGAVYNNGLTVGPTAPYGLPFGELSGASYIYLDKSADTAFAYQIVPPNGVNPFNAYRKTGTTDYASKAFAGSGVHTWPAWLPPGKLSGHPFEIEQIDGRQLDIEAGGSDATIKVEVAVSSSTSQALTFTNTPFSVTFSAAQGVKDRVYRPPAGKGKLYRLQARATLTQGTGETNKTPNGAYLIVRGCTYLDE